MNNIWSKNKYIEISINTLIYFMSMNFMHYGQLLLPIICLIIFIDRKFKFYVKDIKVFVILCLFGISFLAFSYKLGIYCTMGLCLPMTYYIGTNALEVDEDKIKKIIYIIVLGMVTHYILNFIYELCKFGWHRTITKATRYDIWLQDAFVSTGTATNAVIILSISYYILMKEENIKLKILNIILLVFSIFYTIILRRRIQIGLLIIIFVISIIIDTFIYKQNNNKKFKKILIAFIIAIGLFAIAYIFDIYNFKLWVDINSILATFKNYGIESGRLDILISGSKYLFTYIFGGQNISSITGMPFHDLLLDIYDYAGIVTTLLMIVYLVLVGKNLINVIKSNNISNSIKLLIIEISIGYIIMFFLEPLMTGSSLFLIVGILIEACIELLI